MYYPFGLWGRAFIQLSMFVVAYGAMVGYFITIKDTVPPIIGFAEGFQPELVLIVISAFLILPLSMQRDIASLSVTSLLSVTLDIVLVFFVVLYSPVIKNVSEQGGIAQIIKNDAISPNIFIGLGVLSDAMCCQHSSFLLFESLENHKRIRWATVSAISISTSAFLFLILGVSGFLGFGDETQGDVLNNFPEGSMEANVARGLLAITMIFTYPMELFVGRHVLVDLFHNSQIECPISELQDRGEGSFLQRIMLNRRQKMTLGLYMLTLVPALFFDDLGPVLSITGAVGGSCLAYIGPGLVYIGVNSKLFLKWSDNLISSRHRRLLWWYMFGFPIWCTIAERASLGLDERLAGKKVAEIDLEESSQLSTSVTEEEMAQPTTNDFLVALFFVVFGVIALVAGIGTNIYVQLNPVDRVVLHHNPMRVVGYIILNETKTKSSYVSYVNQC
uniref:Amino acid transporter transmembrane domain-containing protein n=1 Tax=Ditylum brightwellii TaxID=49249 RepID=A0A7S4QR31_9STRA